MTDDKQGGPPSTDQYPPEMLAQAAAFLQQAQHGAVAPPPPDGSNGYPYRPQPATDSRVIDLDDQLSRIDTSPQPVKLDGHVYRVRRDFTSKQGAALLASAMDGSAEATPEAELAFWTKLVGEGDATRVVEYTDGLEQLKVARIVTQMLVAAGLGQMGGGTGEA